MLGNINMTQQTYDLKGEIYDICSLMGEGGVLLAKMFFFSNIEEDEGEWNQIGWKKFHFLPFSLFVIL